MAFSYSAVWDDTTRLLRENARLLAAIAGVFIFLPVLLAAYFLPPPEAADFGRLLELMFEYYWGAWPWLALRGLIILVGTAAMLRLVLAPGTSVGGALAFGLMLLPSYFLLTLLTNIMLGIGFILLVVPGLYLIGRLAPAPAIMVAENRRNPIEILSRSFEITRGRGWAVFGVVAIVAILALFVTGVAGILVGIVLIVAAGQELGTLLTTILSSALGAAVATLLLALYAAIYRALAAPDSAAAFE